MNRREDLGDWPAVTTDDFKALFWLIVFALIFIAICSVDPAVQP